ncbi:hypothetical protein NL108_012112 [Boleophthalmus pectinirostris]|uniref:CD99 molecule isoform X1 n=1 Tax=Boleophthalmus pectinirostris TaxID=150288 RepID=UPI00242FF54A|nr:CD99 molecule isoform X1 [Boleophthalmus pectinirostris]KAJ0062425.1 hypothetical protein NL108_012112 [Boleophthalmus pectinirostris]
MKLFFRIAGLFLLLTGTLAQELGFDLADALDDGPKPTTKPPPKKDGELDLLDAFGDDDPVAPKPPVVAPPSSGGGGGGTLSDSDLADVGGGSYEPEGGKYGGSDPGYDPNSAGDQPQAENSGQIAGIVSAIGAALVGAASGYFAYQKKKLCFKLQGGQDPESGHQYTTQSEPQVMSTLIKSS